MKTKMRMNPTMRMNKIVNLKKNGAHAVLFFHIKSEDAGKLQEGGK